MADFTLTIADADVTRVITALCTATGRDVNINNGKAAVIDYIERIVVGVEQAQALAELPPPDITAPVMS